MNIVPNKTGFGYQSSSFKTLSSLSQVNYGAAIGLITSLSETFKLNFGVMYSWSPGNNEFLNIDKARVESGSVVLDNKTIPHGIFIAKVGFTFMIVGSGRSSCRCKTRSSGVRIRSTRTRSSGGLRNGIRIGTKPRT